MNGSTLLMIAVMMTTAFTACVSLAEPVAGKDSGGSTSLLDQHALTGLWILGSASHLPPLPSGVTLSIRPDGTVNPGKLHLSGYTGLNYYLSNAMVDQSQRRFILSTKLATTEKWGPQDEMQFEKAYLNALDGVVQYQMASAQDLTLTTLTGDTLRFHKVSN